MDAEDEFLQLSALQHLLFCERQCYLIHAEQQWAENRFTAAGDIMHEKADRFAIIARLHLVNQQVIIEASPLARGAWIETGSSRLYQKPVGQ